MNSMVPPREGEGDLELDDSSSSSSSSPFVESGETMS
jgi:hypothetical protein